MYTVTTNTERNLRSDHNTRANIVAMLDETPHTLTGNTVWTATVANPATNQKVGDQWLELTAVDGNKPGARRYLALIDNGKVYSTTTPPYTLLVFTTKPGTHKV